MNNDTSAKKTLIFIKGGATLDFVGVAPGILIKDNQETADVVAKWASTIEAYGRALIAAGLSEEGTPLWCVSSIKRTITDKDRVEAESHLNGFALDIAPIYNEQTVTSPDQTTPNLAGDLINLIKLAKIKVPGTFAVIEGDHLHIVEESDPYPNEVISYPTLIPWYNAGSAFQSDPDVQPILNKFYKFNAAAMTFCPCSNEEVKSVLSVLTNYRLKMEEVKVAQDKALKDVKSEASPSKIFTPSTP